METPDEMKSRLELMVSGDPQWDLSDNDMAAIKWALAQLDKTNGSMTRGFICAQWKKWPQGWVARCDQDARHEGRHIDNVIAISWPNEAQAAHQAPGDKEGGSGS